MAKMNLINNQAAFEYTLFMIASSYFKSTRCRNKALEKKMLLSYKELKKESQFLMEDICIRFMNKLIRKIPREALNEKFVVELRRAENAPTEILFISKKYILSFMGIYVGRQSKINCRVLTKSEKNVA